MILQLALFAADGAHSLHHTEQSKKLISAAVYEFAGFVLICAKSHSNDSIFFYITHRAFN
jgi:hypothetical protein